MIGARVGGTTLRILTAGSGLLATLGFAACVARAATRAPGGTRLVQAMEAPATRLSAVGRIGEVRRLDEHGYASTLWVGTVIGDDEGLEPGTPVPFAWEELAGARPPRFANSERVLIVLERLPSASIWRQRLPDPEVRRQMLAIAEGGDAFLREPQLASIDHLDHYLSLAPAERESATGAAHLAALLPQADAALATSAAARLEAMPDLEDFPDRDAARALVAALLREDAEGTLGSALVALAARHPSEALRDELRRTATRAGRDDGTALPPARLFEAWAAAGSDLPAESITRLARSDEAAYRLVAVRRTGGARARSLLRELAADDPEPEVRAVALQRLASLEGDDSLPLLLASLEDADARVRNAAARGAASLGDPGVAALRALALGECEGCSPSADATRSAIVGLGLARARNALREIAERHPDESVRRLAKLALGDASSHRH